ncbi:MAG: hypothetical protein AABZ39_18465 [Spirochaetota bacterium]
MKTHCIPIVIACIFLGHAADVKPLMLERGAPIIEESFAKGLDTNRWSVAIGSWRAENGVLIGKEQEDDHHAAVVKTAFSNITAVMQFNFMLKGTASFSFSINDASGHNSRVTVSAIDTTLRKDADKKDARTFSVVLDNAGSALKPDVWHTMTIEMNKDEMLARIDDSIFLIGAHPGINREKKDFGFPVNGEVHFDDVKVWQAKESAEWQSEKQKLIAKSASRPKADYTGNPQAAYAIAESRTRWRLMQNDAKFKALVDARASLSESLAKTFPVVNQKSEKAKNEVKRLAKEDENYKKMTSDLRKAQADERNHLFEQDKEAKALFDAIAASRAKAVAKTQ